MNRSDWICAILCAAWLGMLVAIPFLSGLTVTVEAVSLDAIIGAAAILFSSAFAIAVPLIIRRMDAGDIRQDALDAALDLGRWAFAVVAAGQQFGIMPPLMDQGLRTQISMAEQRVAAINLTALRSIAAARRVRHLQRLARGLLDVMPPPNAIDPGAPQRFVRAAEEIADGVRDLARIVERRPTLSHEEVMARLNAV